MGSRGLTPVPHQPCGSLRPQTRLLHCRALTCQFGWVSARPRSSFQVGTTLDPQSGHGSSTWARRCALFIYFPQEIWRCPSIRPSLLLPHSSHISIEYTNPFGPRLATTRGGSRTAEDLPPDWSCRDPALTEVTWTSPGGRAELVRIPHQVHPSDVVGARLNKGNKIYPVSAEDDEGGHAV